MTESAILKKRVKEKKKVNAGAVIGYIVLALIALTYIIPFYAIIITSFKATNAIATATPFIWFPSLDQLSVRSYGEFLLRIRFSPRGEHGPFWLDQYAEDRRSRNNCRHVLFKYSGVFLC